MPVYLGEFEQLILLAVLRLGDGASGAAIRDVVEAGSGRTVWIGAVYTTLERVEAKGLVRARLVDRVRPGERRRKIYALQADGKKALGHAYDTWRRMTDGLEPRLESM